MSKAYKCDICGNMHEGTSTSHIKFEDISNCGSINNMECCHECYLKVTSFVSKLKENHNDVEPKSSNHLEGRVIDGMIKDLAFGYTYEFFGIRNASGCVISCEIVVKKPIKDDICVRTFDFELLKSMKEEINFTLNYERNIGDILLWIVKGGGDVEIGPSVYSDDNVINIYVKYNHRAYARSIVESLFNATFDVKEAIFDSLKTIFNDIYDWEYRRHKNENTDK